MGHLASSKLSGGSGMGDFYKGGGSRLRDEERTMNRERALKVVLIVTHGTRH